MLESASLRPVIVEDDAFVGALCGVFEGVVVRERAVLAGGDAAADGFDVDLPARTSVSIPIADGHTALVHGVTGALLVGGDAKPIAARQCAVLSREGDVVMATGAVPGRALLLAGKPFGEPIVCTMVRL